VSCLSHSSDQLRAREEQLWPPVALYELGSAPCVWRGGSPCAGPSAQVRISSVCVERSWAPSAAQTQTPDQLRVRGEEVS